jgi:hypothetical protein
MLRTAHFVAALCAAYIATYAPAAKAQCAARDAVKTTVQKASIAAPAALPKAPAAQIVWKTVALGKFSNSFALRNALDSANCGVGDLAEEALARPAFGLAAARTDVDLVAVSATGLGLTGESVPLKDLYARAEALGLSLAPAEVGPALRLQYTDQRVGEFLRIGMKPIATWRGDEVIFVVVNGGAGLILMGENSGANAQTSASSTFLFVRPRDKQKLAAE